MLVDSIGRYAVGREEERKIPVGVGRRVQVLCHCCWRVRGYQKRMRV